MPGKRRISGGSEAAKAKAAKAANVKGTTLSQDVADKYPHIPQMVSWFLVVSVGEVKVIDWELT